MTKKAIYMEINALEGLLEMLLWCVKGGSE
jgi:hypothetical protein